MVWALRELQLHQLAERQGIPAALSGDSPRPRHKCNTHDTQRTLRGTALPFCITHMQGILAIAIW